MRAGDVPGVRWWLAAIATALVAGALAHPAKADTCDPRYDACAAPRWCPTTGTLIPAFSGYCPIGPTNYPAPWGDHDEDM